MVKDELVRDELDKGLLAFDVEVDGFYDDIQLSKSKMSHNLKEFEAVLLDFLRSDKIDKEIYDGLFQVFRIIRSLKYNLDGDLERAVRRLREIKIEVEKARLDYKLRGDFNRE